MKVIHIIPMNEEHDETESCKCKPEKFSTAKKKLFLHQSVNQKVFYRIVDEPQKWVHSDYLDIEINRRK